MEYMRFEDKYGWKIHSQNNEEGVIEEILKRIDKSIGVSVEFGAPNDYYCSNTRFLKDKGWSSYFFDSAPESASVYKKLITPENVNELPKCNVLSIDTDGQDYEIWKAYKGTPEIVIIEIDSSLNPLVDAVNNDGGVSFSKMLKLGIDKGYYLICHTGNMIFVREKFRHLFPETDILTIDKFNRSWLNVNV